MIYESHGVAETEAIGAELARTFGGGECVALEGPLGAGKTQFVRGMAAGGGYARGEQPDVCAAEYLSGGTGGAVSSGCVSRGGGGGF